MARRSDFRACHFWAGACAVAYIAANASAQRPSAPPRQVTPYSAGTAHPTGAKQPVSVLALVAPELAEELLVQTVLSRNPTLAQMSAAAEAAAARYPQVTSLDDPMFGAYLGPGSFGSRDVDFAYRLEASQKIPYPGKRALRGQNALAESRAACNELADARLTLVESAKMALGDYYLAYRALEVNRQNLDLLSEFRRNAENRYRTGLVTQQDVLQADVEIGRQRERLLTLDRMQRVSAARLNTLMHLPPEAPLPPPPARLAVSDTVSDVSELRALALSRRPDLTAIANRIDAERAALALACREYKPDFEVMAAYDRFWQGMDRDLGPQVGVRFNLPVRNARRQGAVSEAQAKIAQRQAELDRMSDQVGFEVHQAFEQVRESERAVKLYEGTILPAARENVRAAQSEYVTGRVSFLNLVEAQRNLVGLRDRSYETSAELYRRRATLERVVGGPLDLSPNAPTIIVTPSQSR